MLPSRRNREVNQAASEVTASYANGTYTITVKQNGPVDISVKCSGAEINRQTTYADLQQLQNYLFGNIQKFSAVQSAVTGEAYMQNVQKQVMEFVPDHATNEQAGVVYGTFEKKTYDFKICGRKKNVNVLFPAGYMTAKKYPVL